MASSLFALIDDIASVLDDIALLTKVAGKKTAGVLGDDLALNAQQVSGVNADRELPVVFAVAKGSLINKAILVPLALAISALAPWAVTPLLMIGGAYLCFEGVEKLVHKLLHPHEAEQEPVPLENFDVRAVEKEKVKGAIRTDFILSAEIVTISLGTVADAAFLTRLIVLVGIGLLMAFGVYGLVAGIVKLDDLGLYLARRRSAVARTLGKGLVGAAPWLMKALSLAGTVAMFLVGGGILTHGIAPLHHFLEKLGHDLGGVLGKLLPAAINLVVGLVAGALVLLVVLAVKRVVKAIRAPSSAKVQ